MQTPSPRTRAALLLPLSLLTTAMSAGCREEVSDKGGGEAAEVELPTLDWPEELVGIANIDDDDENGTDDWADADPAAIDDDRSALSLPAALFAARGEGGTIELSLSGDLDALRVYGGGQLLADAATPTVQLPADWSGDQALSVEFGGFLNAGALSLTLRGADGSAQLEVEVGLLSAPLILNHHLQPAERVMAVDVGGGAWGNEDFILAFQDTFGDAFFTGDGRDYSWDVWAQDEFEFATLTAPGHRMDVVIDSIRTGGDRGLDEFPEGLLQAPGVAVRTWGTGRPASQDSFGNMEVTPALTADGVSYPFGRVYYGDAGYAQVTQDMRDMLDAQLVQKPIVLDVSWLCVGHVDEFMSFVPDPTAPRGFRLLYADTRSGREFLAAQDPALSLPRFSRAHDYANPGELLGDDRLADYNDDLQVNLDANLALLREELDLTDDEIILLPGIFERSAECGGGALSLIPGTVNMEVFTDADGQGATVLPPDPYFRTDDDDPASDAFIAEIERLLPESLEVVWTDDWATYHLAWGEVHCGSNTQRTPTGDWWNSARHLIGGER